MLVVFAGSALYAFEYRYYLRFVPIPLSMIDTLYDGAAAPAPRIRLKGHIPGPNVSIRTASGLRTTLDYIRNMSPLRSKNGRINLKGVSFKNWVAQLPTHSMYCTGATVLFQLLATQQHIPSREWWLWASKEYQDGNAHSIVEFFNGTRWQVVDPLTATIIYRSDGAPASVADILRGEELRLERSPRVMATNSKDYDTAYLLSINRAPVLNMKPPRFFADTPKTDLVIAYAVFTEDGGHNKHVILTKVAALIGLLCLIASCVLVVRRRS